METSVERLQYMMATSKDGRVYGGGEERCEAKRISSRSSKSHSAGDSLCHRSQSIVRIDIRQTECD